MGFINNNIKAARQASGMLQGEVATALGIPRSTYARYETTQEKIESDMLSAIARLFGYKYADLIDEDFIADNSLQEPIGKYKKGRKKSDDIKYVTSDVLLSQDTLQIKAMLRVLLRSQAAVMAAQQNIPVNKILAGMTRDVRDETSAEFDEL